MTPRLENLIAEIEKDLQAKQNLSPAFINVKNMDDYLFGDDKLNTEV